MCMCVFKFCLEITEPNFTWDHHGIGRKFIQMIQVSCSLFKFCQPPGAGPFSGDFTTNLARQCRAFSRALKIEKLKAPLFRGPEGAGATNDWCITHHIILFLQSVGVLLFCVSVIFNLP